MERLIGKKLAQYYITSLIGKGGMATVYKAYQTSLDRYVAIKILSPDFALEDPQFAQRFEREAKSVAHLNHPNILPIYDYGIAQNYTYIVMRYVEGEQTLRDIIGPSLSLKQAIEYTSQICKALDYAHRHHVIHRDIKPDNILLDERWALLSDFGLVKIRHEAQNSSTTTAIGLGTPAYMSPEQGRGDKVDQCTDIYALGVVLYEMLTGQLPHKAKTPFEMVLKRNTEPPISPCKFNSNISENMAQVILRSLMVEQKDRYRSALEFATELQETFKRDNDESFETILSHSAISETTKKDPPEPQTSAHHTIIAHQKKSDRAQQKEQSLPTEDEHSQDPRKTISIQTTTHQFSIPDSVSSPQATPNPPIDKWLWFLLGGLMLIIILAIISLTILGVLTWLDYPRDWSPQATPTPLTMINFISKIVISPPF